MSKHIPSVTGTRKDKQSTKKDIDIYYYIDVEEDYSDLPFQRCTLAEFQILHVLCKFSCNG